MSSLILRKSAAAPCRLIYTSSKLCRTLMGQDLLRDPKSNKGLSFTEAERDALKIRGLLPPGFRNQELQANAIMDNLRSIKDGLLKYMYLAEIHNSNERLYFRLLSEHTEELLPIVYTPVVGEACQKFSYIYLRPRGLYITANDVGRISTILDNWPQKNVRAICVTDGERILGLGDLGVNGMGIPIGKLSLYTALAGISPSATLPVALDVGTNNEFLLSDPLYIGLRQKRLPTAQYDVLLDEFMEAVANKYGKSCLIQFEDFANANANRLLMKYYNKYCTFNDDIQGTAAVCVAGLIASCNITERKISDNVFLFFGAGSAALGIADLLTVAMMEEGLSEEDAKAKIWLMDAKGLLTEAGRPDEVESSKRGYLKKAKYSTNLQEIVDMIKPSALIGASAQPGTFTEQILKMMASYNERPLIFPLSNPTSKAECTAKEAYLFTEGRCVFASGSPFDPVVVSGKTFHPSQGNNAYIFPGVALAIITCRVEHVPNETFLVAAKALAELVTKDYISEERLYPPIDIIHDVSLYIAARVAEYFFRKSLAKVSPEPKDKFQFVQENQYNWSYKESLAA